MLTRNSSTLRNLLILGLATALTAGALAEKRPEKKDGYSPISVLDSSEAQWGRRSINDSVYRGYTVNAVYLERGRQKLPDTFRMYKPTPINSDNIVKSSTNKSPTVIKVNGKNQKLPPSK